MSISSYMSIIAALDEHKQLLEYKRLHEHKQLDQHVIEQLNEHAAERLK